MYPVDFAVILDGCIIKCYKNRYYGFRGEVILNCGQTTDWQMTDNEFLCIL